MPGRPSDASYSLTHHPRPDACPLVALHVGDCRDPDPPLLRLTDLAVRAGHLDLGDHSLLQVLDRRYCLSVCERTVSMLVVRLDSEGLDDSTAAVYGEDLSFVVPNRPGAMISIFDSSDGLVGP